jgi:hypothetical protein
MSDNRRAFFKKAAGAAVGLAGAEALLGSSGSAAPVEKDFAAGAVARYYGTARLALQLGEEMVGNLKSLEGGDAEAEMVEEVKNCAVLKKLGPSPVKYQEIAMSFGANMAQSLYDWVASGVTCDGVESNRSGAIITADLNNNEVGHVNFAEALLTAFTLPPADASSKDAGSLSLKIKPRSTHRVPGSGKMSPSCLPKTQKNFLPANFRLFIDGLDCTKVNKVEALTILWEGDWNTQRLVRFPNLVVTMTEMSAQSFYDWHDDFVMNENHGNEKAGRLEFLSPTLTEVLLTVRFTGLGIFKVAPDKMSAGADTIKRVTAEMYCNGMTIEVGKNVGC